MKNILFLILFFAFFYIEGQASPNQAGFISYKHISGLTYEASIVTYTKISSSIDRSTLNISWGDGISEMLTRTSQEVLEVDLKKNIYTKVHTYASDGTYTIAMQDSSRSQFVLNINGGNSDGFPFYIESQLIIPDVGDHNTSVKLLNDPILTAKVGETFSYTPTVYDEDGDILYFELVTPKVDLNTTVTAYQLTTDILPGANNNYTFDVNTGNFSWNSPQQPGLYSLTVRISECRNGKMMGYTLLDYQIRVVNALNGPLYSATVTNANDTIAPNDRIQIGFTYEDTQADSIHLMPFSEGFLNGNTAILSNDSMTTTYVGKSFEWIPNTSNARCAPYVITFRGTTFLSNETYSFDKTYLYYVRDANTVYCDTVCQNFTAISLIKKRTPLSVLITPNPFRTQTTIQFMEDAKEAVYTFSLFNVWGQCVRHIPSITEDRLVIERRELPVGLYIYKVVRDFEDIATGKLMLLD
jgi:hypothetical protein